MIFEFDARKGGRALDTGGITKNKTHKSKYITFCAAVENVPLLNCGVDGRLATTSTATPRIKKCFIQRMRPASIIQPEFACRTCRQHYGSRSILSIFFTSCIDFHPPCDVIRISVGNCRSNEAVNNGKTRRGNQLGSLMIRLIRTVPN